MVDVLDLDASEITLNTFKRTEALFESSEAILLLPGGIGTFREFFAMIDEKRTKGYDKPIILFNYNKFFSPLLNVLTKCYEDGFVSKKDLRIGIAYDRVNDETTCSKINKKNRPSIVICSKRTKEMIDKYIDIIDEEFRNITKPNALSYIV